MARNRKTPAKPGRKLVPTLDIQHEADREYQRAHPTSSHLDLGGAPWMLWHNIGEARAKCRQLSTTPLPPPVAEETRRVYLAKGARATTAIEGNTLTEEQ